LPWCYGPGMSPITHVRALTAMVQKGKFITRFNWPGRISVLEASETARCLERLAAATEAPGQIYNLSDGDPITFGQLFQTMGEVTGHQAGTWPAPRILMEMLSWVRGLLPFTLRCLLWDVLWMDNQRIKGLGIQPRPRAPLFLLPLVRWM